MHLVSALAAGVADWLVFVVELMLCGAAAASGLHFLARRRAEAEPPRVRVGGGLAGLLVALLLAGTHPQLWLSVSALLALCVLSAPRAGRWRRERLAAWTLVTQVVILAAVGLAIAAIRTPIVGYLTAGVLMGLWVASVAALRARDGRPRLWLAGGALLGMAPGLELWRFGLQLPALWWAVPCGCLAAPVCVTLASPRYRLAARRAIPGILGRGRPEPATEAMALLSRPVLIAGLIGAGAGGLGLPGPWRWLSAAVLLGTLAELGRRRLGTADGTGQTRASSWVNGVGIGISWGGVYVPLLLPKALADVVGSDAHWVPLVAAIGLFAGAGATLLAEWIGTSRGKALAVALGATAFGALLMALAINGWTVEIGSLLAGAGGGGGMILLKGELAAGPGASTPRGPAGAALGPANLVALPLLAGLLFASGLFAQYGVPRWAPATLGLLAAGTLWALMPILRRRWSARAPRAAWGQLLKNRAVLRALVFTCSNVGAVIPLEIKTVDVLASHGLGEEWGGISAAGILLAGLLSSWWGKRIDHSLQKFERIAAGATLCATITWLVGIVLGGWWWAICAGLGVVALDCTTTLVLACAEKVTLEAGDDISATAVLTFVRAGGFRMLYALVATLVWANPPFLSPEGFLWLTTAVCACVAMGFACSHLGLRMAPDQSPLISTEAEAAPALEGEQ